VAHARQNAQLNHISRARFIAADLLQWNPIARYEIVTANLFSELLIAALRLAVALSAPRLPHRFPASCAAGQSVARFAGPGFTSRNDDGAKWIALLATRKT
jgi:hypothetical protein